MINFYIQVGQTRPCYTRTDPGLTASSSDPSIAEAFVGPWGPMAGVAQIRGVAPGQTTVTVKVGAVTLEYAVTVTQ